MFHYKYIFLLDSGGYGSHSPPLFVSASELNTFGSVTVCGGGSRGPCKRTYLRRLWLLNVKTFRPRRVLFGRRLLYLARDFCARSPTKDRVESRAGVYPTKTKRSAPFQRTQTRTGVCINERLKSFARVVAAAESRKL